MTMQNPASSNIFGWDLVCTNDCTPDAAECGGTQVLANALYRRATSPRGCIIYDLDYGYDLNQFINIDVNTASGNIGCHKNSVFAGFKTGKCFFALTKRTIAVNFSGTITNLA